ncbi:Protein WEAK CHLOROPLAST MOVEMENT UNDER BLUE LIGHT 1 [Striga hermonthica]|uniref:Protein WEAK CHLOROPLAST MOVEMENT UNDER BLUE LIGHT 1 n=1 Tax=Striga hermonthica TaxID=68872 RepID=A0A9N7RBB2_STRHE|nr:Protein WEAK CHLOROPLAST MOVEMENT UNDER BLUE LIGHT 1 [Striga hermonthica]
MGDDTRSKENSPPESLPTSVIANPEMDESNGTHLTAVDTNGKTDFPEIAPSKVPVTTSEDNREPTGTQENYTNNDMTALESSEVKIIARPTPEDDHLPSDSSQVVTSSKKHQNSPVQAKMSSNITLNRGQIDTTAPFESVKAAVSKFGGIVDWKAHRVQTVERRKIIEQELERAQQEIPLYKKQSEVAEEAKIQVIKELDTTKRLIEELKLNLERAQTEEQQAQQDSELAKLRLEEIEQGIADEASFATRAQLEVARARHTTALSELKSIRDELEQLKREYSLVLVEKDLSVKKAEEAVAWSKEIERSVEDLTIQLITAKDSLESAHAAHLEAEEHRIGAVMAKEQDILTWEKELKNTEDELEQMRKKISASLDLKLKLDKASVLLQDLKEELAVYMESKLEQDELAKSDTTDRMNIEAALSEAKKELEEVKLDMEKAKNEVSILRVAASSLKSELEREKTELAAIQQREGMAEIAVSSLDSELRRTELEISELRTREKEEREKMMELPMKLQEAALEADREKTLVESAREELRKAQEEAEGVRAGAATIESRLRAARKEIEAAQASEKLAAAAISALVESESDGAVGGVTLSLEEYYELSKRAHEAEEQANARVAAALSQIEVAKALEVKSLRKLEEAEQEKAERQAVLERALKEEERAKEGKLGVEQELRKWRAEHEQTRRKAAGAGGHSGSLNKSPKMSFEEKSDSKNSTSTPNSSALPVLSPKSYTSYTETDTSPEVRVAKKKKRSLFPKILMFLSKKKSHAMSKKSFS